MVLGREFVDTRREVMRRRENRLASPSNDAANINSAIPSLSCAIDIVSLLRIDTGPLSHGMLRTVHSTHMICSD